MTPQSVWKVELRELSAIEVVCSSCGGSVSIPLTGNREFPRSMNCPGCGKQWWDGTGNPKFMEIYKMVQSIESLQASGSQPFTLQFPVV
jgi:uncharacterized protein with PIN domain